MSQLWRHEWKTMTCWCYSKNVDQSPDSKDASWVWLTGEAGLQTPSSLENPAAEPPHSFAEHDRRGKCCFRRIKPGEWKSKTQTRTSAQKKTRTRTSEETEPTDQIVGSWLVPLEKTVIPNWQQKMDSNTGENNQRAANQRQDVKHGNIQQDQTFKIKQEMQTSQMSIMSQMFFCF